MAYKLTDLGAVYDGPVWLGTVHEEEPGCVAVVRNNLETLETFPRIGGFPHLSDACEWLVAEHRDIPWADRPLCQRRGG